MKTINMLTGFMTLALVLIPTFSYANTYKFVDTSGNLQSVEANSATEALATAYPLALHSGVWLVDKNGFKPTVSATITTQTTGSGNYYLYINTSGDIKGVWAPNASVALATAYQLALHSGVWLNPAIQ